MSLLAARERKTKEQRLLVTVSPNMWGMIDRNASRGCFSDSLERSLELSNSIKRMVPHALVIVYLRGYDHGVVHDRSPKRAIGSYKKI